jgi:hypothetical protein
VVVVVVVWSVTHMRRQTAAAAERWVDVWLGDRQRASVDASVVSWNGRALHDRAASRDSLRPIFFVSSSNTPGRA